MPVVLSPEIDRQLVDPRNRGSGCVRTSERLLMLRERESAHEHGMTTRGRHETPFRTRFAAPLRVRAGFLHTFSRLGRRSSNIQTTGHLELPGFGTDIGLIRRTVHPSPRWGGCQKQKSPAPDCARLANIQEKLLPLVAGKTLEDGLDAEHRDSDDDQRTRERADGHHEGAEYVVECPCRLKRRHHGKQHEQHRAGSEEPARRTKKEQHPTTAHSVPPLTIDEFTSREERELEKKQQKLGDHAAARHP